MTAEWWRAVSTEPDVVYGVVSDTEGSVWIEFGDRAKAGGIPNYYFANAKAMPGLAEFLKNQPVLPKTIMQGRIACVICKPNDRDIVGLFTVGDGDVLANMQRGEELDRKIRAARG